MQIPSPEIRARFDLLAYLRHVHNWEPREHQLLWVNALQKLADGELTDAEGKPCNKLLILAPPGSGKTDTVCQFTSWYIGKTVFFGGTPQVGYLSYSDTVAWKRSVAIRDTIAGVARFRDVFPTALPAKDKGWGQDEWFLQRADVSKKDPTFRGAGFGGSILSYRFPHLIVIDDPHGAESTRSASETLSRDKTWDLWNTVVKTRGTEYTPIVMICTRFAQDDLAGRIMGLEKGWHVIRTSALVPMPYGGERSYCEPQLTNDGTPFGVSIEELYAKREVNAESFMTQYMCLPPSEAGEIFKWWQFEDRPDREQVQRVYQFWDTATYGKNDSDYNAMVEMVYLKDGHAYINSVFHARIDTPTLLERVATEYQRAYDEWGHRPIVKVENKNNGGAVVALLTKMSGMPISGYDPKNTKLEDRAAAVTPYTDGRVWFPREWTPWKDKYITQLKAFPRGGRHEDDMVSATVMGLEYIFTQSKGRPRPWQMTPKGWGLSRRN